MTQSQGERHSLIRLEVQVQSQQQTIAILEQQLAYAQVQNERLMARLLGGAIALTHAEAQTIPGIPRAPRHTIPFAPPPVDGPGLPMPVQAPKGSAAPTPRDLAQTYTGEHGDIFSDVGDDEARRLGLEHDDVSGSVQQGKRQPLN